MTLNSMLLGSATAAVLAVASIAPAQAITPLYSGGGTLAEKVYRDAMNCYGNHSGTDTEAGASGQAAVLAQPPATCNGAAPYRSDVEILYVGVGSGNGKAAFVNHDASHFTDGPTTPDPVPVASTTDFGPFYGTGAGAAWVRNTTDTGPFPTKVSFIGSDDPLVAADITTYNANNNGWGAPIQVPGLITTVAIPYHPAAGTWTEKGKKPSGGGNSGLVDLSTNTLCGIFTGAITTWNDPAITADNSGVVLGTGTITVVYRSNSSGTTFLVSNALINQCASTTHPVPDAWQTAVNGTAHNTAGVGNNSWFINVKGAGLLPANFLGASGSGGVKTAINGNAGSIGYVSPDFVLPIDTSATASKAANLQTWASVGGTAVFKAPTAKAGTPIVGATKAPSFAKNCASLPSGCATNPLAWGVTFPKPVSAAAYPIGGFTFIDAYTCYASAADADAMAGSTAGSLGYLRWFFGTAGDNASKVKTSLNSNGFALIPGGWLSAAKKLISTNKPTLIGTPGQANTGCAGVTGNGA